MFLALLGVTLAFPTSLRAESASAPDSTQMAVLRVALLGFDDVRVVTDGKRLSGRDGTASPDGLQLRLPVADGWSPPEAHLVPWAEIETIEVRKGGSAVGPLLGGALGFTIGTVIVFAESMGSLFTDSHVSAAPMVVGLAGGAAIGALLTKPGPWRTVYP